MKIAIFLPNWIGDAVMATPALRAIRQQFTGSEIVTIQKPYVADVLEGLDFVDRKIAWETKQKLVPQVRFLNQLRRERFDVAVLFPNSFRSAWMSFLAGIPRRIGISRDSRHWLLTDPIPMKNRSEPHPAIDEYLRIATYLIERSQEEAKVPLPLSRSMSLSVTTAEQKRWQLFLDKQSPEFKSLPMICLNPGGAFGAAKHWPTAHFAELSRRIAMELKRSVLVVCGPAEKAEALEIVKQAKHPMVASLAAEPPHLGLTKAAIRQAALLVTTDSGPRHFAAPFQVPVVTLFGPTHILWSETFYEHGKHLQLDLDCGPCQQRVCPLGHHRCMKDLGANQVFQAVVSLLNKSSTNAA